MPNFIVGQTAAQTDADSPVNQILTDGWRVDIATLDTKLGEVYDGTDVATGKVSADSIATGAVHQSELNTATSTASLSVSGSSGASNNTLSAAGEHGFVHVLYTDNAGATGSTYTAYMIGGSANPGTTPLPRSYLAYSGSPSIVHNFFATSRYVAASPPNPWMGLEDMPGWLYVMVDDQERPVRGSFATEPPWHAAAAAAYGPEVARLHPDSPSLMPQPFLASSHGDDAGRVVHASFESMPPGWEVRAYDLRHLMGPAEYLPAAERLGDHAQRLNALVAGGNAAATSALEMLRRLAADEAGRRQKARAARQEVAARGAALLAKKTHSASEEQRLLRKFRERDRELRLFAGDVTDLEARSMRAARQRGCLLVDVLNGQLPLLGTHTRSISDDKQHPDYKHLPEPYRKRTGQPFVRYMVAP